MAGEQTTADWVLPYACEEQHTGVFISELI